jgi:hypothetical protein
MAPGDRFVALGRDRLASANACGSPFSSGRVSVGLSVGFVASKVGEDGQDPAVGFVGLGQPEFGEDVADVFADGRFGDDEVSGDSDVGVSFGDEGEYLAFSGGERG